MPNPTSIEKDTKLTTINVLQSENIFKAYIASEYQRLSRQMDEALDTYDSGHDSFKAACGTLSAFSNLKNMRRADAKIHVQQYLGRNKYINNPSIFMWNQHDAYVFLADLFHIEY